MYSIVKQTILLIVLSLTFISSVKGQDSRQANMIVEKIDIVVLPAQSDSSGQLARTIQSRLKTKPGSHFSQSEFDTDLKMLIQDYDRVEPHVETHDGAIWIRLDVWQNPYIRNIFWEGVQKIKTSSLKKELNIKEGSVFNRVEFNKQFNKLKTYYVKEGFFETELSYDTRYDEVTNQIDIIINVSEGRAGKIKQIHFSNFSPQEEAELLQMMVTKKYNFFMSWMTGEGTYNEEAVQHDRLIILNYLQCKGYADAKVDIEVKEATECNRIIICITADRGEFYTIDDICLEGNKLYTTDELLSCMSVASGDPFSPEDLHNACNQISNYYGKFGYIEASAIFEPTFIEGKNAFCVKILIEEGEQYYVGLIKVLGNCTTQTNVILHETLLTPGEVFNLEKLKRTEQRLANIGYFSNVNVYAVKTSENNILLGNYRDVHIEVEETNTGNLGAFFGLSTMENMFGGVNITECNFNYKGFRRLFSDGYNALRGGGEYAHITLSVGMKSTNYALSWTKPYFMDTPWSVGFDLEYGRQDFISDDIDIKSLSFTVHGTYLCNAFVKVGPHIRFTYSDINISDDDCGCGDNYNDLRYVNHRDLNRGQDPMPVNHKHGAKMRQDADNCGLIAAVGMSWVYNSTNHPTCPTNGFRSAVEGEVAGFNGQSSFLSFAYLNTYYKSLWKDYVLKLRADFRFLQPVMGSTATNIPLDERFFLGGDNQIRGYRPFRLGPKIPERCNYDDDDKPGYHCNKDGDFYCQSDDPEGGVSLQLFSAEISKPLFSRMDAFVFFDVGAVSINTWQFGGYYYALGFGAKLKIMEGGPPLTLGLGFPLNYKRSTDVKRFFFTLGGKF